ncbi:MAG: DUF58 domain-containing protein [Bacteroidetes bacterium HGW-Bacteroidetes-1]|jgi:uncharacterized protein (DUF58 family)|nr:MAG: DUF58 domain-containing protein [Bacteroidetes bacterium HGW-Bacteroidetes-1]
MPYLIEKNNLSRFGSLELLARQVVEGFITGLHKSPFHGFSVEFAEHRLYNSGESIRHIDWKLFGRTEKLFVKKFEEETNLRCQLVIDHSSSMYFPYQEKPSPEQPDKLIFSVYAAASLMELMRHQRDAVGLSFFSQQLDFHTRARSSRVHQQYLIKQLEQLIDPDKGKQAVRTSAAEALHLIAERTHQRSLVIIFSDMMDDPAKAEEMFPALRHLRYNKHEVVLFHVMDHKIEEELDLQNRPYRFIDMETKETIRLNPVQIQEAYRDAVLQRKNELKLRCGQYHIDYIEADIHKGYNQVLTEYMIKRSRMY